jgi:hypothetical protein
MDAPNRDTQEQPTKEIHEVVGVFDNLAALQSAIDQLLTDGFDRSEISVLAEEKTVAPNRGYRRAVELEDDDRAPRLPYIESESLTEGKASLVGGLFYIGFTLARSSEREL